jgi:hypothetical protein
MSDSQYSVYIICRPDDYESKIKSLIPIQRVGNIKLIPAQYLKNNGIVLKDLQTRYNTKPDKILSKLGCISSHRMALLAIYNNKTKNNIILEADAELTGDLPGPPDKSCYIGGWLAPTTFSDKKPLVMKPTKGMNEIDYDKFRVIMTHSYFIKTPEEAIDILQSTFIPKIRNYDIHFANTRLLKYYYFPPIFTQTKHESEIDKRTNTNHELSTMYGISGLI